MFSKVKYEANYEDSATYGGVFRKTILLLAIVAFSTYTTMLNVAIEFTMTQLITSFLVAPILAFIMAMLSHRMTHLSFMFSMLYGLFEGMFLGVLTLIVADYAGTDAVMYAITATFGTVFVMLLLYVSRIIKVTEGVRSFLVTAVVSVVFLSISNIIMFYVIDGYIFSTLYISISIFTCLISALFLLFDFRRIESAISSGVDRSFEWSLGLGLVTTIVWLYIEILRIIMIFTRRN